MKVKRAINKVKLGLKMAKMLKYIDPNKEKERIEMIKKGEDLLQKLKKLNPNEEINTFSEMREIK